MIPFEYRTPKSLKEVQANLKEFGADAKLIAGGTALVIMMKQRLVRPTCLVSLRSVRGLGGSKSRRLNIGGLATIVKSSSAGAPQVAALAELITMLRPSHPPLSLWAAVWPTRSQPGSTADFDRPRHCRSKQISVAAGSFRSTDFAN
jgi:hypothetical protein